MNIGQAASHSGLATKTVRYYEEIGLIKPARCANNAYRDYSLKDIDHLRFIQRARAVGFSLDICRELLALYRNPERQCSQAKTLLLEKIQSIDLQLRELTELKLILTGMADSCAGDNSQDYPAVATLAKPVPTFMSFTLVESAQE